MKVEEIITAIHRFRYKPGYRIEAMPGSMPGWVSLRISAHVPYSRGPSRDIEVQQVREVVSEAVYNLEVLKVFVRELVQGFECHESDEWLRFGGELVSDPHQ